MGKLAHSLIFQPAINTTKFFNKSETRHNISTTLFGSVFVTFAAFITNPGLMVYNAVKQLLFIGLVVIAATSCTTLKRPAAATTKTAHPAPVAGKQPGSPRFIENISINPDDSSLANKRWEKSMSATLAAGPNAGVEFTAPLQFKYAILLDVPVEEITDGRIFGFIESWYGTRYRYGGTDKNGVDCSAFVQTFISAMYGLMLPRTSILQFDYSKRIRKDDLQEGDLVFFKTLGRRKGVSHVGVYLRNNKFVHASTSSGVTINDINDVYYSAHFAGAGRVR